MFCVAMVRTRRSRVMKYLWACHLLTWSFVVSGDYEFPVGQPPVDARAAISWDRDGGYVMFCLCMGE